MIEHSYFNKKLLLLPLMFLLLANLQILAQEEENSKKRKSQITPLPAISYSPETGATIGVIGDYYFDLAKGDTTVSRSRIRLLTAITSKGQFILEPGWELYTPKDNYRIFGEFRYRIFNDRNYGLGNTPNVILTHYEEQKDGAFESQLLKYQPYDIKILFFEATFLKKIKPNLYIGPTIDYDNIFDVKNDSTRNSRFYPTNGFFGQFNSSYNSNNKGANYSFNTLDVRYYINVVKNHTFAARVFSQNIFGANANEIPIFGLARFGGRKLVRGYYDGTYQHENALTFQTEYRLPFTFLEDSFLPLLGRLGAVAFFSGGQVYGNNQAFAFNNFRLACGAGIRFNINKKETTNVRIDYGFGLHPQSSYENKGQRALYFFLSEAF